MTGSNTITDSVIRYAEIREAIDTLSKEKAALEAELKPLLADLGAIQFGDFVVDAKTMPGRKTLDKAAVEQAFGNLNGFMKQGKPFVTVKITRVQSGSDS